MSCLTSTRNRKKTNRCFFYLAPHRGLPSQCLSTLLVRSYRTFAPLPNHSEFQIIWRYFSVALSSRSLALGVIQQVWALGSPDFPQTEVCNRLRLLSPCSSLVGDRSEFQFSIANECVSIPTSAKISDFFKEVGDLSPLLSSQCLTRWSTSIEADTVT